ncbi:DUF6167 family protein [Pseudofrankia asymbiotica]|uniref:Uncharacterized protein n=1 Tax=Pseudofrankia asymbiotica TaxID=1834516 RepID=A0A1V2I9E0_9ACTN|nr:DUF6167 family protein [Pseudofrankia asymbiotica]ONH29173.1 hypothetical protein BL253_17335 [Pseudofrankia asymbiotica]
MSRRLFYVTFGAVAGVLVVRQAAKAAAALSPGSVAGSLAASLSEFMADVREFMAEREDELRDALGLYDDEDDELPAGASEAPSLPDPRGR